MTMVGEPQALGRTKLARQTPLMPPPRRTKGPKIGTNPQAGRGQKCPSGTLRRAKRRLSASVLGC